MTFHVFFFFLLSFLLLTLAWLDRLCLLHHSHPHWQTGAVHPVVRRLLKPRTPLDCPDCRLSCAHSSVVELAPTPVRPWSEVKSRRGAPKRIQTEGFACPNQQCPYFGITDDRVHALVGDGKHGRAERIQTFRCQVCRTCTGYLVYLFQNSGREPSYKNQIIRCLVSGEQRTRTVKALV